MIGSLQLQQGYCFLVTGLLGTVRFKGLEPAANTRAVGEVLGYAGHAKLAMKSQDVTSCNNEGPIEVTGAFCS
jgi:hypothetical protein